MMEQIVTRNTNQRKKRQGIVKISKKTSIFLRSSKKIAYLCKIKIQAKRPKLVPRLSRMNKYHYQSISNVMKRVFFITALLALAGAAVAQTHVLAEAQLPDDATKMIVRDYLSPATVSYIATASQNFFAYADAGNLMRCMPLDSRYDVRDMKVSGGNVYFCGQDTYLGRAFLGWFNVTDVLNGVDGFHIYGNFTYTALTCFVEQFDQLEVYQGDNLHIALVGKTTCANTSACFAEVVRNTSSGAWSYQTACPLHTPSAETATNIVQNDNYFISGGMLFNNHEAVSMRFFKKDSMFTSGIENTAYRYTDVTGPTAIHYPRTGFAMAVTDEDLVATASFWSHPGAFDPTFYNNYYEGVLVNVYKISSTLTASSIGSSIPITAYSITSSYAQPIASTSIGRMTYSAANSSLLLQSRLHTPYGQQGMISEVPVPTTTTIPNTYLQDYDIWDIDNTFATNRYVGIGVKKGRSDKMVYYSQPANAAPLCARTFSAPVSNEDFECKAEYVPLKPDDTTFFRFTDTGIPTIFYIPIAPHCQH